MADWGRQAVPAGTTSRSKSHSPSEFFAESATSMPLAYTFSTTAPRFDSERLDARSQMRPEGKRVFSFEPSVGMERERMPVFVNPRVVSFQTRSLRRGIQ